MLGLGDELVKLGAIPEPLQSQILVQGAAGWPTAGSDVRVGTSPQPAYPGDHTVLGRNVRKTRAAANRTVKKLPKKKRKKRKGERDRNDRMASGLSTSPSSRAMI